MTHRKSITLLSLLLACQPAAALNIMVTNDDGVEHPWIRTLHATLSAAGHQVTTVAPSVNQSGQSAALSLAALQHGDEAVTKLSDHVYSVEGSPATASILGVKSVLKSRPDLIVSGINEGANIGVISAFSGTVGATVAALNIMGEPIPAIAISGNLLKADEPPGSSANLQHATEIAQFVTRLVGRLEGVAKQQQSELLPRGIALNVNYPAVAATDVQGVGIYRHGRDIGVNFSDMGALPELKSGAESEQDTVALRQGYITVVPIDGDYTAPNWREVLPNNLLQDLNKQ